MPAYTEEQIVEKTKDLDSFAHTLRTCRRCTMRRRCRFPVPGSGLAPSDVMVVGQAPGWQEDKEGIPFIEQAGEFLSTCLNRAGLDWTKVYFTNACKCYPGRRRGGDNAPDKDSLEACEVWLRREIELVQPKVLVAIGAISMKHLGVKGGGININNGKVCESSIYDLPVIPLLHPAGLMRPGNSRETPKFVTGINAINTFLSGGITPPAYAETARGLTFDDTFGLDIETEGWEEGRHDIWCTGVANGEVRTAQREHKDWQTTISPDATPVCHNAVFDLDHLGRAGIEFDDFHDTILEAHMLGHKPLGLKALTPVFTGNQLRDFKDVSTRGGRNKKLTYEDVKDEMLDYCSLDAWATWQLHQMFYPELEKHPKWLEFYEKEKKISRAIIQMQRTGLPISQSRLDTMRDSVIERAGELEEQLHSMGVTHPGDNDYIGRKFWHGKSKIEHTKTGRFSTREAHLMENRGPDDDWVELLIEWRKLMKFLSTYIEAYRGQDFVHPSFNQTGTQTWRWSCSNPNFQNVPKSTAVGIYQLFVAPEGYMFVSFDYSQVELRALAIACQDPVMLEVYRSGGDIHDETMRACGFDLAHPENLDLARRLAKIINFGIIYGMTPYGAAPKLGVDEAAAAEFIGNLYNRFKNIEPWQQKQIEHALEHGYVESPSGRPLWVPNMSVSEGTLYHRGTKQCQNFPIQCEGIEVVKTGMLQAKDALPYLVCQVHDELLYLVPEAQAQEIYDYLAKALIVKDDIDYTVEGAIGKTWGDIKHIPDDLFDEEEE